MLTRITIITISYNSEKTIEQTIKSVLNQKYKNLEYWIIDGGSSDNTMKIVEKYAEDVDYIKYISENDRGISDAFNKGIEKATGELIGLINSDDKLVDGALNDVNRRYLDTGADVIYGDTIIVDVENEMKIYKHAGSPEELKYEMPFIHQSSYIKKTIYERFGKYSNEYKICMDYDMLARIYYGGCQFAYIPKPLSVFQYGGTSCKHPIKTINEDMKIAVLHGLSRNDMRKYKCKRIPICIIKIIMSKLHIWTPLYRIFKGRNVLEEFE